MRKLVGSDVCGVVASDKEHDFVRLVTDFVSQLGLQLNVNKLIEVSALQRYSCTDFMLSLTEFCFACSPI